MNKNEQPPIRSTQTRADQGTKSAGVMRVFYVLILLFTILSLFVRIWGGRRTSTPKPGTDIAARVLVFHREGNHSCEDLTITSAGDAIFSNCGNGAEKQFTLSNADRAQLQTWIAAYSAVNYDHNDPARGGSKTQLYLNGQGKRQANEAEVGQLIDFAETLTSNAASQS